MHCHYVLWFQYPQLYYSVLAELELKTDAFFTIFSRIICSSNVLQLEIISVTYGKNKSGSGHYGSFHKFGLQVIQQLRGPNLTQLWPDDPHPLLRGKTSTFYSSVVEFQRWWVLKWKINCTLKVNFRCQKSTDFFQKKNSSKNINLGDHFLLKTFFSRLNF